MKCELCKTNHRVSKHHIVPRKYGINDNKLNLIPLCDSCHNIIEIKTDEWIESGKEYSSMILKKLILNTWNTKPKYNYVPAEVFKLPPTWRDKL